MDKLFLNKILFAHRGASGYAPENTLPAMQLAKKLGANWVEFDVTLTKDNELIVFHDKKLHRTTNGHGTVAKKNLSALKQLDAGSWFSQLYQGTTIPTLMELLHLLDAQQLNMNLEIKPSDDRVIELVTRILCAVDEHWPKHHTPPLYSSFSPLAMEIIRQQQPQASLGLLMHKWLPLWEIEADKLSCQSVHLNFSLATPQRVAAIKNSQRAVFCYTVNDLALAKRLFEMGVDGVFSDYADLF